jgi:hypothetical protein
VAFLIRGSAFRWALALSLALLALRLDLAGKVGFGDAEALYACYAIHPQPAYLDHPGLVGVVARAVGHGMAPTPVASHRFAAIAATALPWVGVLGARLAGSAWGPALRVFFPLALAPEVSIGLFALTPDLPLSFTWIAALGFGALSLRSPPGSRAALAGALFSGFCIGLAIVSKMTGLLLLASLGVAFAGAPSRAHLKTAAPWLGLAISLILAAPVFVWERKNGFPMLAHRLVETQSHGGLSLRNVGALAGGQLLYVTPPFLIAAYRVFRDLLAKSHDPVNRLFVLGAVIPGVPLAVLCSWSRVAEPHWLAPAYLSLALGAARSGAVTRRVAGAAVAVGVAAVALAWLWVGTPLAPRYLGHLYVPRYDLANDLYAWQGAARALREEVEQARHEAHDVAIVGPHWVVCAQVHAALGMGVPVGCESPNGDDFGTWYTRDDWASAATLIHVTDDRFALPAADRYPDRAAVSARRFQVYRGGRAVRTIRITRLDRKAVAQSGEAPVLLR